MASSADKLFEELAEVSQPVNINEIKMKNIILLKDKPCEIISINKSEPGKHGHAKTTLTGFDIFTGKKHEETFTSSARQLLPIKVKYQVLSIDNDNNNKLSLIDEKDNLRDDIYLDKKTASALMNDILKKYDMINSSNGEKTLIVTVLSLSGLVGHDKIISANII